MLRSLVGSEMCIRDSLSNKRKGRSGRRGINLEYLREALKSVPAESRTSQRAVAVALGIPHTTLHNNLKKLGLKTTSRSLKPPPTDAGDDIRCACGWTCPCLRETRTYDTTILDYLECVYIRPEGHTYSTCPNRVVCRIYVLYCRPKIGCLQQVCRVRRDVVLVPRIVSV